MALSPDDWCTRKEAAAYLHVSVQTITRYCLSGAFDVAAHRRL